MLLGAPCALVGGRGVLGVGEGPPLSAPRKRVCTPLGSSLPQTLGLRAALAPHQEGSHRRRFPHRITVRSAPRPQRLGRGWRG